MLKEEPYLLADHWSRVLEDIYVSDWGSITIVSLDDVKQTSSVVDIYPSREGLGYVHLNILVHCR